jgi:4-hydroxybenzoate polyprenyltransferase
VGAWIGVTGAFALPPLVLAAAVVLWTAGFDVIYSLEDVEFDRRERLFSVPARFGERAALWIARGLHAAAAVLFAAFGLIVGLGALFYVGIAVVVAFLIREHTLVRPGDLSKLNEAFFVMNGYVSVGFLAFTLASVVLRT